MRTKPIKLREHVSELTHEEFALMRQGKFGNMKPLPCTIGGSDASTVFDLNPWTTSLELYNRKTGVTPEIEREFNEENKEIGNILEDTISQLFVLWYKKHYHVSIKICSSLAEFNESYNAIYNDDTFYQCGETDENGNLVNPQSVADIDRLIKLNGRIGVLEIKSTTNKGEVGKYTVQNYRSGKPPIYYEYQVRHYMGVLNVDFGILCCSWNPCSLQDMAVIYIERDMKIEDEIFAREREFASAVINRSGWSTNACKSNLLANYYTRLYGEPDPLVKPVEIHPAYFPLFEKMVERTNQKKELQKKIDELEADEDKVISLLANKLGKAERMFCRNGNDIISVDVNIPRQKHNCYEIKDDAISRKVLDVDKLKQECPDLWQQYQTTVFDVKTFKLDHLTMFKMYELPKEPTGDTYTFKATRN